MEKSELLISIQKSGYLDNRFLILNVNIVDFQKCLATRVLQFSDFSVSLGCSHILLHWLAKFLYVSFASFKGASSLDLSAFYAVREWGTISWIIS